MTMNKENDLLDLTMLQARRMLQEKKISVADLVNAYLDNDRPEYNTFITRYDRQEIAKEIAIAQQRYDQGNARPLEGLPLGIKDLFCTKGKRTTAGSKMLDNFVPTYESTVTQKLLDNGAIFLGKLNMDEFAMGSSGTNSAYGPSLIANKDPKSPEKQFVAGGSSSGSASCVNTKQAIAAIGSDTGGSVRLPAAWSGCVGIKPTYGTCSRYGMVAFSSSLDQAGPISKDIDDGAMLLSTIMGHDIFDQTTLKRANDILDYQYINASDLKIGIVKEWLDLSYHPDIAKANRKIMDKLQNAGAKITEVSLKHIDAALQVYYVLAPAEAASNLSRYDGIRYGQRAKITDDSAVADWLQIAYNTRTEFFGREVKRRIMTGNYVLSSEHYQEYYQKALDLRQMLRNQFTEIFDKIDVILSPVSCIPAYALQDPAPSVVEMYNIDIFTIPANIAGLCALSVPVGLTENGLPIGMQVMAAGLQEKKMLAMGKLLESLYE